MLGQMESEVERGLEQDEDDDRGRGAPVIAIATPPTMIVRCRTTSRPYGAPSALLTVYRRYSPRPM